jgi:hypothetical protein
VVNKNGLGFLQKHGYGGLVISARTRSRQRGIRIQSNDAARSRKAQLPQHRHEYVPRLEFFFVNEFVLFVGAFRAIKIQAAASFAVFRPSAALEMPAAESLYTFFAAFKRTCRMVNS